LRSGWGRSPQTRGRAGGIHCALPSYQGAAIAKRRCLAARIKHDGFRVIARKDGDRVRLYSRPGNDLTYRFALIVEGLARLRSDMMEEFPDRPKGMHWRTYHRLRRTYDIAEARSNMGLMHFVDRLQRRVRG
jgi:hypothetical protein